MAADPQSLLDQITTYWPAVRDPAQFVRRYAPAIQAYLGKVLADPDAAREAAQDFFVTGLRAGFVRGETVRGRFRDYLRVAVRNAARTYARRQPTGSVGDAALAGLAAPDDAPRDVDDWRAEWRRCALDRAWQALDRHQRRNPGNLAHTVLRLTTEYPKEDSVQLAARAAAAAGRPLAAEAFRKQVSRARRLFAGSLVTEATETLADPTPEQIEEELADLGLLSWVRDFLPPDWRPAGRLTDE